jgi:hypothetical protein
MKKFIRHLAIENFLAEEDGLTGDYGPNNFYVYRFANTHRFTLLPWDKSNTFWSSPDYPITHNISDGAPKIQNQLVLRALKETDLRELWLNTILECAEAIMLPPDQSTISTTATTAAPSATATITTPWLSYEVTRISDQIREATYADPSREVYTNTDFDESVRFLTTWAQTRADIVKAQVAADRAARGIR